MGRGEKVQFTIIAVGKLKEKYLIQAVQEYVKRIQPLAKLWMIELKDESLPAPGSGQEEAAKEIEAARIRAAWPVNSVKIALDLGGQELSSPELAMKLAQYGLWGQSHICFIIGGGAGLASGLRDQCQETNSFSRLTFPHQLFRVILLEQLYRSLKINRNEPYHR